MASPRPRGPPPLDPAAKPEVQPRYVDPHPRGPDPAGKPKVRPRDASPHPHGPPPLDPLGEPELHVSPDHPRRTHSIAKLFMSQFLDIPLRKSKPTVEQYSSVCIEKGFLSYFAHHPVIARISSDDPEPSNFDKLTAWFRKNAVTDDQYLKKFVKMVLEFNGISIGGFTSANAAPFVGRRFLITRWRITPATNKIRMQNEQILEAVRKTEENTAEGVELLKGIKDVVERTEGLVKSLEDLAGKEVEETVISEFTSRLNYLNNHEISKLVNEIDTLANRVGIPFSLSEKFRKIADNLVIVGTILTGLTTALSYIIGNDPAPTPPSPKIVKPGPNPSPAIDPSRPKTASGPRPFTKLGKDAKDVLQKDYNLEPLHGEIRCKLSQFYKDPTVVFKVHATAPSVKAILSHNQLWGSDFKGSVSLKLPFARNTSMAKVQFLHDRLSLNVILGLDSDPHLKIAALVGSSYGAAGGCLGFNTRTGSITDLDIGGSITDGELGTLSTLFKLANDGSVDAKHGAYKAFYSKKHKKNTYAVEMEYKLVEKEEEDPVHTVVSSAGILHQFDSGLMLKAKLSSSGLASGMVQFSEGIAASIVRASVQVDLRHLDRPPRAGFSISSDPTK